MPGTSKFPRLALIIIFSVFICLGILGEMRGDVWNGAPYYGIVAPSLSVAAGLAAGWIFPCNKWRWSVLVNWAAGTTAYVALAAFGSLRYFPIWHDLETAGLFWLIASMIIILLSTGLALTKRLSVWFPVAALIIIGFNAARLDDRNNLLFVISPLLWILKPFNSDIPGWLHSSGIPTWSVYLTTLVFWFIFGWLVEKFLRRCRRSRANNNRDGT